MWNEVIATWESAGTVEYGVYQRATKPGTPLWRRHVSGRRFGSLKKALFAPQGARNACLGVAQYARDRYSASDQLFLPYAAAWLRGSSLAFLVRASTPNPEVTLVDSSAIGVTDAAADEQSLTNALATLFGDGARRYGVRLLEAGQRVTEP